METTLEPLPDRAEEAVRGNPTVEASVLSDSRARQAASPRSDRDVAVAFIERNGWAKKTAHRLLDELQAVRPLGVDAGEVERHEVTVVAPFRKLPNISTSSAHSPCRETHHA